MQTLYQKAYAILANVTPIPADCGMLCSARCCTGGKDDGMILFPKEAEFLGVRAQTRQMQNVEVDFFVCDGTCNRARRPLSCRIFPFAPYLKDGELSVIPDPRAPFLCPLLEDEALPFVQKEFLSAIKSAFEILCEDDSIREMLTEYSAMLDEYQRFTK